MFFVVIGFNVDSHQDRMEMKVYRNWKGSLLFLDPPYVTLAELKQLIVTVIRFNNSYNF